MTSKANLVLLPGFMCDHGLWDRMAARLSAAAELHFGNLFEDDSIPGMAARVLSNAPETFSLAGFSMGGYVAREIVMTAPERVERLALMNTSAEGASSEFLARRQRMIEITRDRPFTGMAPTSLRQAVHPDRADDRPLLDHIQTMARRLGKDVFIRQMGLARQDGHARLAEITCPTLVVSCDQDRLRSVDEARALANGIPDARLEIMADCGHMTPLEQPNVLAELMLDWLAGA